MNDGLASFSSSAYNYAELVAGKTVTVSATITGGQGALIRGTILGRDPATGKWATATWPAGGILTHDVDTTAGDITGLVHIAGDYKDNVIVLQSGHNLADTREALRDVSIILLDVQE